MSKCLFESNYISEIALILVCPEQRVWLLKLDAMGLTLATVNPQ